MKIAILAWGSLLRSETMKIGKWQIDGPFLPLELSRISNDGRLTLVIDSKGVSHNVFYAISKVYKLII